MNGPETKSIDNGLDLARVPPIFRPFAAALIGTPGADEALIRLLGTIGERAPHEAAESFALQLRRSLPDSAFLRRVTDVYLRKTYPAWYIHAVNDRHRNAAYERALLRLVTPESIVIEAGTGSGLFAMLAARAGAKHVYTCEISPEVAEMATENIERNRLSDRVTVLNVRAEALHEIRGIPKGDLLIHEFVSGEFLNAGIHSTIAGFRKSLLKPGAHVLPQYLGARGMLVGDEWLMDQVRVPTLVAGLDLVGINRLAPYAAAVAGPVPLEFPMSRAINLIEFDLCGPCEIESRTSVHKLTALADGIVQGLLQWVVQRFPDGSVYENRPEFRCNWKPIFWPFRTPRAVRAGDLIAVSVVNTATELFIEDA